MANKYAKALYGNATVTWSHLHKPDVKFGNPNYNITVELTSDLEQKIRDAAVDAGFGKVSKVNGIGTRDTGKVLKVKNSKLARMALLVHSLVLIPMLSQLRLCLLVAMLFD